MAFNDAYYQILAYQAHYANSTGLNPIYMVMQSVPDSYNIDGVFFYTSAGNYLIKGQGYDKNVSVNVTRSVDDNGIITTTGKYTITNNGESDFTITKVLMIMNSYTPDSLTTKKCVVVDSIVLDAPVTITAGGGVGQITYTITSNYQATATTSE